MTDEQRQRIHDIEYSCDSREELAERIVGLEDKVIMYENDHQIALRTYGSWKRLKAEVPKLREENAKLREELAQWERLTAGIELPEYPISQFQPKDLERENAKLRELVHAMEPFLCCMPFASCDTLAANVRKRMSELGIEVD